MAVTPMSTKAALPYFEKHPFIGDERVWMRTGDLGFLSEGELFITGRIKEMMLAEQHEIFDIASILFVRPGQIPRTSSGKIRRGHCRELYHSGGFNSIWRWDAIGGAAAQVKPGGPHPQTSAIAAKLATIWQDLLGIDDVRPDANILALGSNSLILTQGASRARAQFGVDISLEEIFRRPTLSGLSEWIASKANSEFETAVAGIERRREPKTVELSFAQQRFWLLDRLDPQPGAYNICHAVELRGPLNTERLQEAFNRLIARHEVLRTAFSSDEAAATVTWAGIAAPVRRFDLRGLSAPAQSVRTNELL